MRNFNGVNGSFVIIDPFTLSEITDVNTGFKLFYFSGGIVFFLSTYLKFIK